MHDINNLQLLYMHENGHNVNRLGYMVWILDRICEGILCKSRSCFYSLKNCFNIIGVIAILFVSLGNNHILLT